MSNLAGPSWYVAQTHPRAEAKAAQHLQRQGFDVYLPRYLKRRRHARRVDHVATPLFPRYLFVSIDLLAPRWRAVHSTIGVANLICHAGGPVRVADEVVQDLMKRHDDSGLIQLQRRSFSFGDPIRVQEGAFSWCVGLYESMTDRERVTVLLDLLGRKVRVTMNADFVAAA